MARRVNKKANFTILAADETAHAYEEENFARISETEISVKPQET